MREAAVKNAQAAYDRASTLLKSAAGTQKALDDAEAACARRRRGSIRRRPGWRAARCSARSTGTVQQIYFRVGELVPAGKPMVAILPPGNMKVRFFVNEAMLPKLELGDPVNIRCDGCADGLTAKISFIARTAEFTPPVIYSLEERSKLVFMIEALPEQPEQPARRPAGER